MRWCNVSYQQLRTALGYHIHSSNHPQYSGMSGHALSHCREQPSGPLRESRPAPPQHSESARVLFQSNPQRVEMNSSVDFDWIWQQTTWEYWVKCRKTRGDINTIDHTEHERSEEDGHEEDEHGITDNIQESVMLSDEDESSPLNQLLSSNTSICTNTGSFEPYRLWAYIWRGRKNRSTAYNKWIGSSSAINGYRFADK